MMKMRIALAVVAAAMMPFSAVASPNPQQLVDDLTTGLRYGQHNVDDTRHSLSHPLLRDGDLGTRYFLIHPLLRYGIHPDRIPWLRSEDPRRLLEGLTSDLLLDPRIPTDGNDLETVLCGSAQAPTREGLLDLLEFCKRFFEPGFAAASRYSEGGDLSFTVVDAAVLLNIDQLANAAHDWGHGWRQITGLDGFRITITSSDESLIATIRYDRDRWSLSFVEGSAGRQYVLTYDGSESP